MTDASLENGSGRAPGKCPSPELLVAAFRKATGRRDGGGPELESQDAGQQNGSAGGSLEAAEGAFPRKRENDSLRERLDEVLSAFRKARGDAGNDHSDSPTQNADPLSTHSKENSLQEQKALPTPSESVEELPGEALGNVGENSDSVSEDIALAFRRVFYKRRVRRRPLSQSDSDKRSGRSAVLPPRPATSFVWLTRRTQGTSTSIGIGNLSGLRARRAGAFLLRGEAQEPYRLLKHIRGHTDPRIYLKPVFWRGGADHESAVIDHVDGTWTPRAGREALRLLRERAAAINRRVQIVVQGDGRPDRVGIERRLLRFVATRTDEFAPHREEGNLVYPKLTPLLGEDDSVG